MLGPQLGLAFPGLLWRALDPRGLLRRAIRNTSVCFQCAACSAAARQCPGAAVEVWIRSIVALCWIVSAYLLIVMIASVGKLAPRLQTQTRCGPPRQVPRLLRRSDPRQASICGKENARAWKSGHGLNTNQRVLENMSITSSSEISKTSETPKPETVDDPS